MPEALATTKRKFHKLLDSRFGPPQSPGLAPPASASALASATTITTAAGAPIQKTRGREDEPSDSATTIVEPAPKRIRSGDAPLSSLLPPTLHHRNGSNTTLASTRSIKLLNNSKTTQSQPTQSTRQTPGFAPWSHDAFLERLRTFSRVTLWHPKPEPVNEVEWAKRGWSCVDTNTVSCKKGCAERILVNVEPVPHRRQRDQSSGREDGQDVQAPADDNNGDDSDDGDSDELERALAEKYRHLIIEGHADGCLWRQAGCKDDIYRLPIVKTTVWQPELRERYGQLLKINASFQNANLKPTDISPPPRKLLADFPETLLNTAAEAPEDTRAKALLIAMCGWHGVIESGTELLCCNACFQRVGLWMYQPDYKRPRHSVQDDDDDNNQTQDQDPDQNSLDLVDLHREHCPWRNSVSQSATGDYAGLPAWKILHRILGRYADENRRRSRGGAASSSRAASEVPPESDNGVATDIDEQAVLAEGLELMPELTREETERLDKERTSRLRKIKTVFGFNKTRTR